ncbi:DUF3592 domain-containing protein [Krasilnikovia sp. MM14-A1259]|uniref:DUF3592 domain-containing protein n=1 Tax=Krasilnikovia sp. MM14-A1259 TaxID=3373539 RepID=UPI00381732B8
MTAPMPPAGWYPDPYGGGGGDRWWDGQRWTGETSFRPPVPSPAQPAFPSAQPAFASTPAQGSLAVAGPRLTTGAALAGAAMMVRGRRRIGLATSLFLLVFGLAFVLAGWAVARPKTGPGWVTTTATVMDVTMNSDYQYRAIYRYNDRSGQQHTLPGRLLSGSRPTIGETTDVAYNPVDPDNATVTGGQEGHFWMLFAGVGTVVSLIGAVALLRRLLGLAIGVGLLTRAWLRRA